MSANPKLAVKVLKEMQQDMIVYEGSLLKVESEETRIALFKEIQEYKKSINSLLKFYAKMIR